MKRILLLAMAIACSTCATTSRAGSSDIEASNNQFVIQRISTNVDYMETGKGTTSSTTGTLDTETGNVFGYAMSLSWMDRGVSNLYCEAEYNLSNGGTKYTGMSLNGGVFGSMLNTSSAKLTNFSARFGKGFLLHENFMLTPYVELSSHKWDRGVNSGESYSNNWLGIGALGQFSPVSELVFTANALLGNTEGSSISVNSGAGITGFTAALGNSVIFKAGLSADYAFTKNYHGNIGIDYTNFKYHISHVVPVNGGSLEPDSRTNYTLVKLGVGYAF